MKRTFAFLLLLTLCLLLISVPALATEPPGLEVSCDVCLLCPAPLGFCVFYWAIAILVVLILLLLLIKSNKRCPICHEKCRKRAKVCPYCNYNFETGEIPAIARYMQTEAAESATEQPQPASPAAPAAEPAATEPVAAPQATPPAPPEAAPAAPPAEAAKPAETGKSCPACGKTLPANALFCGGCGQRLMD